MTRRWSKFIQRQLLVSNYHAKSHVHTLHTYSHTFVAMEAWCDMHHIVTEKVIPWISGDCFFDIFVIVVVVFFIKTKCRQRPISLSSMFYSHFSLVISQNVLIRGCNPFEILIRSVVLLSDDSKIIPFGVQIQWEGFRRIQTFTRAVQILMQIAS